ncbi:MAG: hypothetical protein GC154_15000 [bacterium]|nr:hypothetical protein [bacterium]
MRILFRRLHALCFILLIAGSIQATWSLDQIANAWRSDFETQREPSRPRLEARYVSAARDAFIIDAERYLIELGLGAGMGAIQSVQQNGEILLRDGYFELEDRNGSRWSSLRATKPSRINLYRRGPYYDEVHWLDLLFENENGQPAPIRGEVVFYCYPESCRLGLRLHATETMEIQHAQLVFDRADGVSAYESQGGATEKPTRITGRDRENALGWFECVNPIAFQSDDGRFNILMNTGPALTLEPGEPVELNTGFVSIVNGDWNALRAQTEPLPPESLVLKEGLAFKYDARRGDYVVSTYNPGGFNYHYYENQNDYRRARIAIRNSNFDRKIYLRHEVGDGALGQVECGVTLDAENRLLPIVNQISKNFAGEKEEKFYNPQDTPFSETFIPIHLKAGETRELTSLQLYQNWGDHPLKQFSSLGAWMDYFHMSTGVTETTCYVPFKFYTGISIADLRGMSGTMWESQPQHDNVGGHIFMEYQATDRPGARQAIEYMGTDYHSTGPVWSHITFHFLSSDGRVRTELETFEYPQLDELRNFIRLRVTALDNVPIANWGRDFRIMQIDTKTQQLRYQKASYLNSQGELVTRGIQFDDLWTLDSAALANEAPMAALWNSPKGNNAFIVEGWRGTLGGEPLVGLALSCQGRKDENSNLILTPQSNAKGLKKGDAFEIDLFIMPYGKAGDDYTAALRERDRYGLNPVRLSNVRGGEALANFPPRIHVAGEVTEFTIGGGRSTIAVLVEGLDSYTGWDLERETENGWSPCVFSSKTSGSDIDGEGQQRYVCDDGLFGAAFRVELDGGSHRYRVVRTEPR